jgi:hypothetical protein
MLKASRLWVSNNTLQYSPAEDIHEWASNETNTALLMCDLHWNTAAPKQFNSPLQRHEEPLQLHSSCLKSNLIWEPLFYVRDSNLAIFYDKQVHHAHLVTTKQKLANHAFWYNEQNVTCVKLQVWEIVRTNVTFWNQPRGLLIWLQHFQINLRACNH